MVDPNKVCGKIRPEGLLLEGLLLEKTRFIFSFNGILREDKLALFYKRLVSSFIEIQRLFFFIEDQLGLLFH